MRDGMGATWMLPLLWLGVVGIIVGGRYLLYRALSQPAEDKRAAALDELRLTYARGEISDEEFEKRRERLEREEWESVLRARASN